MHRWDSFRAERTLGRRIRGDVEPPEILDRYVEARRSAGSVDEDRRARHCPARRTHGVDRLLKRTAGRHDVVDHELAGDREPAPKLTTRCPFAPLGIDRVRS